MINRHRLKKMETRNKCMMKIFGETQYDVLKKILGDKNYYKTLLEKLVIQVNISIFSKIYIIF